MYGGGPGQWRSRVGVRERQRDIMWRRGKKRGVRKRARKGQVGEGRWEPGGDMTS